jgi:hypothetical protein
MPFLLGVAIGLGALLAADSRRYVVAGLLAGLSALASPVSGLFTGLAGVAVGVSGARQPAAALPLPPAAAILLLSLGFPTMGEAPFVASSFIAVALFAAAALWLLPAEQRALRIPNPLGGNVVRLGALFAGPLAALYLLPRPALLAALAVPLLYWQLDAPIRDATAGVGDPSTERAFYEPLIDRLEGLQSEAAGPPARVHVPPTANRWEAVYVAEEFPLARGWLRQLESDDFDLFQDGNLSAGSYRAWLIDHGVGYVAVPRGVVLDYLADDEVELIDAELPYLRLAWENEDWRLYRVTDATGLLSAPSEGDIPTTRLILGADRFTLFGAPGEYLIRIRWSPYWEVIHGDACAEKEGDSTRVEILGTGEVTIAPRLGVGGVLGTDRVCSG